MTIANVPPGKTAPHAAQAWSHLSAVAKASLLGVILVGVGVALWHLVQLADVRLEGADLLLGLLALVSGTLTVRVPLIRARISLDTLFIFTLILQGAGHAGVVLSGVAMAVSALRGGAREAWHVVPYNFATGTLAAALGLVMASGMAAAFWVGHDLVVRAFALALGYFALNLALVAWAVHISRGIPLVKVVSRLAWTFPAFLGAASVAALLDVTLGLAPLAALLLTPLGVILYGTLVAHRRRVEAVEQHRHAVEELYLPTVAAIAAAIEARDAADGGHHARVQGLAMALAEHMGIKDDDTLRAIRFGALLHDVGRIALPDALLLKEEALRPGERMMVEMHPILGAELIRHIPFGAPVAETILYHHERLDGSGYPEGLKGDAIPLPARITAVAEVYDTMTSPRPYAPVIVPEEALAQIERGAGTLFDAQVVHALGRALRHGQPEPQHRGATSAVAIIAQGAIAQALERHLSRSLPRARSPEDVVTLLFRVSADLLHIDACAMALRIQGERGLSCASTQEGFSAPPPPPLAVRGDGDFTSEVQRGDDAFTLNMRQDSQWSASLACRRRADQPLPSPALLDVLSNVLSATMAQLCEVRASERMAFWDPLTGIRNAQALARALEALTVVCEPDQHLVILFLDLDGFKGVNDHFGHQIGDDALVAVGAVLGQLESRLGIEAYRKGGDEFLILARNQRAGGGRDLAHTVRTAVEALTLRVAPGEVLPIKTSVGVAEARCDGLDLAALMEAADQDMYQDKAGRDRLPRGARPRTLPG